jgi:phage-related protein
MEEGKSLKVAFYRSLSGSEPVRDWIRSLSPADRHVIGCDLRLVELGWPVGMPLCRPLGGGLWEVRSKLSSNRICRVIFSTAGGRMVLLHAFFKATQKTPDAELRLARARKKEVDLG